MQIHGVKILVKMAILKLPEDRVKLMIIFIWLGFQVKLYKIDSNCTRFPIFVLVIEFFYCLINEVSIKTIYKFINKLFFKLDLGFINLNMPCSYNKVFIFKEIY